MFVSVSRYKFSETTVRDEIARLIELYLSSFHVDCWLLELIFRRTVLDYSTPDGRRVPL